MKDGFTKSSIFHAFAWVSPLLVALVGCGGASSDTPEPQSGDERLYVGMGEYDPARDWHAIMRFEGADNLDSSAGTAYQPDATITVKEVRDKDGTALNFAHGLYLVESRDEMVVASIFTSTTPLMKGDPMVLSGSVGFISKVSEADGAVTMSRHLFGDATTINQPHGVWVDESRDTLFVANTFGKSLLMFEPASTVTGNVAPKRTFTHPMLGNPVFVYVDEATDTLFVAVMNSPKPNMMPATRSAILIYQNASTLSGTRAPDVVVAGPKSRLDAGNNRTTHNVWFDRTRSLLLVGHHTNELLIYDLSKVNLAPDSPTEIDLAPRVLEVHEKADGSDIDNWSVYGLFPVEEEDRLYVSCGHAAMGPTTGSPPNAIKVYEGLLGGSDAGRVTPSRVIHWAGGDTYLPPQPLWVQRL